MEAYQAYYNTNEASSVNATQVLQTKIKVQGRDNYPLTEFVKNSKNEREEKGQEGAKKTGSGPKHEDEPKVINNITHID